MGVRFGAKGQGKKKGQEGYGRGEVSIAFDDDVLLDEEAMVETLLACFESPDYKPPALPAVAIELMNLSQRAEVDFGDVIELLEQDGMLAGRVLKRVGSAAYSGANPITSLHESLVRLGLRALRDLVMEIALTLKVFKCPEYAETMELLRRHATATAHVSKLVSNYTSIEGEYAFMAGLLHDVGIAGILLALAEQKGRKPPDLVAIWPALDRVHERAGEAMATQWELPPEIRLAVSAHHQVMLQGHAHPLAAVVCVANEIVHELGAGVIPDTKSEEGEGADDEDALCVRSHTEVDRSGAKTLESAREALRLADAQLELIRGEAAELEVFASR